MLQQRRIEVFRGEERVVSVYKWVKFISFVFYSDRVEKFLEFDKKLPGRYLVEKDLFPEMSVYGWFKGIV